MYIHIKKSNKFNNNLSDAHYYSCLTLPSLPAALMLHFPKRPFVFFLPLPNFDSSLKAMNVHTKRNGSGGRSRA